MQNEEAMKKILVVYYSQTGQMSEILRSLTRPLKKDSDVEVDYEELQMKEPFPFPWTTDQFWEAFPESIFETPFGLEPFHFNPDANYDLVILACQPWFLSPSIPISSFLQTPEAARVLKNTPVATVIAGANMWLTAQEKLKNRLQELQAVHCGSIALADRHSNIISLVTSLGWLFKGKREGFLKVFPRSGVSTQDIEDADQFGEVMIDHLMKDDFSELQDNLMRQNAISIRPALLIVEKRLAKTLTAGAHFIRKKGRHGSPDRKFRLKLFAYLMPLGIILLSPFSVLLTFLTRIFRQDHIQKEIHYFSSTSVNMAN